MRGALPSRWRPASELHLRLGRHDQLEAGDAAQVQPGAAGAADQPEHDPAAAGAAGDHPGSIGVDVGLRDRADRAAGGAPAGRGGDIHGEKFSKCPAEHVSVEVGAHDWPPEGPKRSVLMSRGSWPALTRRFATVSTNPVGPHTNTAGLWSGAHSGAVSAPAPIRPGASGQPGGVVRVYTYATWSPSSPRCRSANSAA